MTARPRDRRWRRAPRSPSRSRRKPPWPRASTSAARTSAAMAGDKRRQQGQQREADAARKASRNVSASALKAPADRLHGMRRRPAAGLARHQSAGRLRALAAALAGGGVEVAAGHRRAPIGDQVLGVGQVVRPLVADDQARGLPDDVELAVGLDFADEHRLGDVVVRHHGRVAAGEVRHRNADDRVDDLVRIGGAGLLDRLHPHVEADDVGFHRIVGGALRVLDELLPLGDERPCSRACRSISK